MRESQRTFAILIGILFFAGCDASAPATGVVVRDSLGVMIIENSSPAWDRDEGWTIAERPMLDLGGESGSNPFYRVVTAFSVPGERIAVLNAGSQELQLFKWSGEHIATTGGTGDGPGEFRDAWSATLNGNQIVVYDGGTSRLSLFDLDGQFRDTRRVSADEEPPVPLSRYRLVGTVEGRGYLLAKYGGRGNTRLPEPTIWWDSASTILVDESGDIVGTFGEPAGTEMYGLPGTSGSPRWGATSSSDVHEGEFYIGDGREYEVRVYDADGRLSRVVRRAVPRVSGAEADERLFSWVLSQPEVQAAPPQAVAGLRASIESTPRTELMPVTRKFLVDGLGYLWAEQYRPSLFDWEGLWVEGPPRWDVFDPDGEWLGEVVVPSGLDPMEIGADYVLGVWTDDLGTEHVRVHSLEREI